MPPERLDDLESEVEDLEARMAGLAEEFVALRTVLEDVAVVRASHDTDEVGAVDPTDTPESAAARATVGEFSDGETTDSVDDDVEAFVEPPTGASQEAVDDAVERAEDTDGRDDHEETIIV